MIDAHAVIGHAESLAARHRRPLMIVIVFVVSAHYMINAAIVPADVCGDDGKGYERLGHEASLAPSLFSHNNFYHSYWSPGWVATIGALYRRTGRTLRCVFSCPLRLARRCPGLPVGTGSERRPAYRPP